MLHAATLESWGMGLGTRLFYESTVEFCFRLALPPWPVKTSFVTLSPLPAAVDANTCTVYGIKFSGVE